MRLRRQYNGYTSCSLWAVVPANFSKAELPPRVLQKTVFKLLVPDPSDVFASNKTFHPQVTGAANL